MTVETIIEDARWAEAGLPALAERAAAATLAHLGLEAGHEIAVLGCDDARIAGLNGSFRARAGATNVLSWPSAERGAAGAVPGTPPAPPDPDEELGDIAIAFETCAREAREAGLPLSDHAAHLIVHAVLHLLGYDHEADADAHLMERTEAGVLATMAIPDPYWPPDAAQTHATIAGKDT